MKFLVFVFIGCLSVWTVSGVKNKFNDLVDEVIYEMEQQMINQSATVVKLPNIDQSFTKKILFFNIDGRFKVNDATVQNLSTIYRVGDVIPTQNQSTGTLNIKGTFAMKDLTVKAKDFDLKVSFIHVNDPLTVNVGRNGASFSVSLKFDENMQCTASLDYATVSQLGDFHITLGSGVMYDIEDYVANYVMDKLSPMIQKTINNHIFPIVSKSIEKLDLCNKLM